jgi:lipase chaperone LimK
MRRQRRAAMRAWQLGIGTAAALCCLAAFMNRHPNSPRLPLRLPPAATVMHASTGPMPAAQPAAPSAAPADTTPPRGLETDHDGRLVINQALHDVFDYFLLGGHPGPRADHVAWLLSHLKASLPPPAAEEAARMAGRYLAYIDEHDRMLPRVAMPAARADSILAPADVDPIAAWIVQRTRLRQSLLGMEAARTWFEKEDAQLLAQLDTLRQPERDALSGAPHNDDSLQQAADALRLMAQEGASPALQREYLASRFGDQAAQRFDAIERDEQAWQAHYAGYRRAADQVMQDASLDAGERAARIEDLRKQGFATDSQRMRVRALDARSGQATLFASPR